MTGGYFTETAVRFNRTMDIIQSLVDKFFSVHASIRCTGQKSSSGHHYTQSPVILKDSSTLTYVSVCSFCGNSIEHLIPINRTTEQLTGVSLVSEVQ